jgi:hypothetical protein
MRVFLISDISLKVRPNHPAFRDKHALGLSHFQRSCQPEENGARRLALRKTPPLNGQLPKYFHSLGLLTCGKTRQWR